MEAREENKDALAALAKTSSSFQKKMDIVRKKWIRDQNRMKLYKYETRQLHALCTRMIKDGRLTLEELKSNVDSLENAKIKLKLTNKDLLNKTEQKKTKRK